MCLPSALTIPGVGKADLDQDGVSKDERILKNVTKVSLKISRTREPTEKK